MADSKVLASEAAIRASNARLDNFMQGLDNEALGRQLNTANREVNELAGHIYSLVDEAKKFEADVDSLTDQRSEYIAINGGLRFVIRHLLVALRAADPENPLLIKQNRDTIFAELEKQEINRMNTYRKSNGYDPIAPRLSKEILADRGNV